MVGELQLSKPASHRVVVFHYDFFRDDPHVEQVTVENLFAVTKAGVETGMSIRIADKRNLIAHLQYRIAVRVCQNTVATDAFNVATGRAVNTELTQVFSIGPCYQFRADTVSANDRQVYLPVRVSVRAAFTGNLLGTGL